MKVKFTRESLIAITVIISLCILYFGIEYLKGINLFKPANFYYAKFEKVDGLAVSAPITINGFQVGQVREINYDYESNDISVLLSLNKNLRIPKNSNVKLSVDMLGTAQLVMSLSDSKEYYEVGDEIPSGTIPGLMDALGKSVMPSLDTMLPKIDSILTSINAILANPALNNSVTRLDGITANLQSSSDELSKLMSGNVPSIMNNVNGITANLNATSANINELSAGLKELPLDEMVQNANSTMANLKLLSDNLNNNNSSLGLLMNDPSLYQHLDNAIASLDTLLTDLQKNPKRYVTFKVF
ncbi:MAG: MlaD family protein [Muribaculaceae bacterium]